MLAGIAVGMLADTFAPVWFVVTAQLLVASVTLEGAPPVEAVVIVREGAPVKLIWSIAFTANVTV
jgi:hypothetical protein